MRTKPITKKEQAWIDRVEKLLMNPPSDRLGLYTIGDRNLSVYDLSREDEINAIMDRGANGCDFCVAVNRIDASLGEINSSVNIHSTAG